ncbi:hypothetical protein BH20ACI1_BH20ACI1_11040 [soil metagenome]
MNKSKFLIALLFCLSIICVCAIHSQAQEQTEIEKWMDDICIDTQKGAIFDYTYLLKLSYDKYKKGGFGRKFTRVYEAILPSRFTLTKTYTHPLVLIEDSENPVTPGAIDLARQDLVKEMERAEKVVDKPDEEKKNLDGGYWTMQLKANKEKAKIDIFKMVKIAQFSNLQKKQIDGREIISMDFTPQAAVIFDTALTYISKIEGQIWIDAASKRIIRVEGFPIGTFKEMRNKPDAERENEAVMLFLQTKVAEGFWFPKIVRLDFTKHPEIFETIKLEFSFSDYKKSSVEIRNTQIKEPEAAKEKLPIPDSIPDQNK